MFKRILIVIEPHPHANALVRAGASLAKAWNADILYLGGLPRHRAPARPTDGEKAAPDDPLQAGRGQTQRLLLAATAQAEERGVMSRSVMASGTGALAAILSAAQAGRCDLIMVGSEGSNAVVRLLSGSVIPGLVTASPLPVLVHAPPLPPADNAAGIEMRRILVILEDRGQGQAVLTQGLNLARTHAADLLFVHILPPVLVPVVEMSGPAGESSMELAAEFRLRSQHLLDQASAAARKAGLAARGVSLPAGTTARDLARLAVDQACDLIAVSHAGSNAVMRLLTGSPIPGLITAAGPPLLICPELAASPLGPSLRRRRHRHQAASVTRPVGGPPP